MRIPVALAALSLAAAACHEASTSPFSRPSGPAPSGLPVTLLMTSAPANALFAEPGIWADGDSVVAGAGYEYNSCLDYSAVAGMVGGALVVTITESANYARLGGCFYVAQTAGYRAVVRPAPRGTYAVVLRRRIDLRTDGPVEQERVRGTVTVR